MTTPGLHGGAKPWTGTLRGVALAAAVATPAAGTEPLPVLVSATLRRFVGSIGYRLL